jgi:chromosome segregation ATPase
MQLLNPNEIKADSKKDLDQARARTHMLADEEGRIAQRVNIAREDLKKSLAEIDSELASYKQDAESKKNALRTEIAQLQEKRRELLEPIEGLREAVAADARTVENNRTKLEAEKIDVEKDREENKRNASELDLIGVELNARKNNLDLRESTIIAKESALKESSEKIVAEFKKLEQLVGEQNDRERKLDEVTNSLDIQVLALQNRKTEQDKREAELNDKQKALRSGYSALEQAKKHLGIQP